VRPPFRDEPFVLSVSTVEIRKNHILLAKLWSEMTRSGRSLPHLVVVGKIGWDADEFLRWVRHAPELEGRVHVLADVDDDELVAMYDAALFTVFPSRAEGWGLPITESLGRGKACVHSDDPAQIEASQGLMPMLHPDDFVGWRREIERLLDEPSYLAQLELAIEQRYQPRTQDEYCSTFEQVLLGPDRSRD
jgi:glycosyltransferase involved in cell wall biosynthesis